MDYNMILESIYTESQKCFGKGKVSSYIPPLARIDSKKYGIAIKTVTGEEYKIGDADEPFSIQSISKVFTLTNIFHAWGNKIWKRVGKEPSSNQFNSLIELEKDHGIPRNPFINAGALVITDMVCEHYDNPKDSLLDYIKKLSGNNNIIYNEEMAASEAEFGYRNAAVANFLKSSNNLKNSVQDVLDTYFHQCSIEMSCIDLCRACLFLANNGKSLEDEVLLGFRQNKKINSLMMVCGLYNEAGNFAWRVGIPGKSGIGGGIVAIVPGKLAITVWSPELNKNGNSFVGFKTLESFTTLTKESIF
ncbi:MAG: glutaminase [Candidatus Cloacimonadales bacterium]|jgi:glutaminase|nr:glutaminase [Candidatus Cloacimonadota bacterium]MDX9978308.1 glutaminase [Candidatus Cloacimonadales bacterium]